MKVALVTGPCPSGQCGVGDYTMCLADALKSAGVDAHVITAGDWGLPGIFKTHAALRKQNFDIVHIQYPTAGFGTKLGPQALSLLRPCVVTIHEASQRHVLRKLSLLPFTVRPQRLIFTSSFERRFVANWAPWISRFSFLIPVASNIQPSPQDAPRTLAEIVHFGLIMPKKGLEDVLALGALIKASKLPLAIHIIGQVPPRYAAYVADLRLKATEFPIVWHDNLSDKQVAQKLARSSIAYLPYPDGASDRRTTLKAALISGLAVVTTTGQHTPRALRNAVASCGSPQEALTAIRALIADPRQLSALSSKAVHYAGRYSWERIAKLHLRVYQAVLNKSSSAAVRARWSSADGSIS